MGIVNVQNNIQNQELNQGANIKKALEYRGSTICNQIMNIPEGKF